MAPPARRPPPSPAPRPAGARTRPLPVCDANRTQTADYPKMARTGYRRRSAASHSVSLRRADGGRGIVRRWTTALLALALVGLAAAVPAARAAAPHSSASDQEPPDVVTPVASAVSTDTR